MRNAVREQLITAVTEVSGRVFEPQAARRDTPKPYLVIRQGVDTEDTPWTGFRQILEVWPYLSQTTFADVDALAAKITAALGKDPLTTEAGEVFTCQYLGAAGPDLVDTEWDAITRGLRFAVLALQPVAVPETVENDPWLEALATWTKTLLGEDWEVYRNVWPLGYQRPSVMWRLTTMPIRERGRQVYEIRKRAIGHVLGRTRNEQIGGALKVVEGLGAAIKILLDQDNKRYLTIAEPAGNLEADGLTAGQLSVALARLTNRPIEEAPLMQHITGSGSFKV
jgi:hypothetical protein